MNSAGLILPSLAAPAAPAPLPPAALAPTRATPLATAGRWNALAGAFLGISDPAAPARRNAAEPTMPTRSSTFSPALVGVLCAWAVAVALVGVDGEFPLSDDWAYAHVVRSLCDGKGFDLLPWTGASLVLQALYGAAACELAGFSHEVLRLTTLALSAIGIVAFHALLRALGAGAACATAGCALLAFSPLWFNLSFTFMTDVPFAALAIVACWLYVRAFERGSRSGLLLAGAVAAASFLVRQHALPIAVAAAAAALWPRRSTVAWSESRVGESAATASRALDAAAAIVLPLGAAVAYGLWAAMAGDVPLAVHNKLGEAASTPPLAVANAAFRSLATLGFLFLPWALTMRPQAPAEKRAFAASLTVLAGIAVYLFAREGSSMFYLTNVLGDRGVGAVTTRDVLFLSGPTGVSGRVGFLDALITAASLASAAALVTRLGSSLVRFWTPAAGTADDSNAQAQRGGSAPRIADPRPALFCVLALALSAVGTLAQAHYYFDRYVLVLLPLAVASVVAVSPPPRLAWMAGVALVAMAAYSIAGTHDYMQWNRARWQMLATLEAAGVAPEKIDGGVEYNAHRLAAKLRTAPTDAQARSGQPATAKSWWWVVDDEWIVAFRPLDGYVAVDSRSFVRWLPPGEDRVLTLRREGWPTCDEGGANPATPEGAPGCAPANPR